MLADRSPGRSNQVLPAEVTKRDDTCHPDPHSGQHVASRRELYLSPMMCLASRRHAPHAMAYWYRPVRTDVCSMSARMPRYPPTTSGTRSAAPMRATGQNGSSRHVLALFDSSSRRINEQSSGLLIRGFGVQVPGGAPGLTWGFTAPGHFLCARFVPIFRACWLRARSRVPGQLRRSCHFSRNWSGPLVGTGLDHYRISGRRRRYGT